MGQTLGGGQSQNWATFNALIPAEGPRVVPFEIPFDTGPGPYWIDLTLSMQQKRITAVQSVWVDNSLNSAPVQIQAQGIGQTIIVPPNAQGYVPILAPQTAPKFTISSSGNVNVPLIFLNVPVPSAVWNTVSDQGGATGGIAQITPTSRSVVTVAATSTQLMAANSSRKYLLIQAPQSAGVWLNFNGGVASVGGTDCFYLAPGQPYESGAGAVVKAINYYCATGSLALNALEG